MPGKTRTTFSADALSQEEILALKDRDRRNRNIGAAGLKTSDFMQERGPFALQAEAQIYLRYLAPRPHQTVLDAGAGMGRIAVQVAPRVKRLVALDLSSTALEVLATETKARHIANVETSEGDLCNLPSSLGPFDSVYSIEAIQHIPSHRERLAAVRNLRDLLKPQGKCLISVFGWNVRVARETAKEGFWGTDEGRLYHFCFTPDELRSLMVEAGLRNVTTRGVMALPGRMCRRLPLALTRLEAWCTMVPQLAPISWFVMAIGER